MLNRSPHIYNLPYPGILDSSSHSYNLPWHSRSSVTTQLWSALAWIHHHIAIMGPGIVDWSSHYWYLLPLHDCTVCVYLALTWQISHHASAWWDWCQDLRHETWKSARKMLPCSYSISMPLGQFDKRCSKQSAQKDHEFDSSTCTKKWRDKKKAWKIKHKLCVYSKSCISFPTHTCIIHLYHPWLSQLQLEIQAFTYECKHSHKQNLNN